MYRIYTAFSTGTSAEQHTNNTRNYLRQNECPEKSPSSLTLIT